ncbi:unnamed protein product [Adineta steineri]|uniref:Uncharacterized protein n=1 Tax=Adineta steineri TaxID=433720 RepID=A0A814JRS8_9BILA|nr:unnamed protein product [Adineta steineri]CAF3769579.1 unnamed protein product [Adineta steineri]
MKVCRSPIPYRTFSVLITVADGVDVDVSNKNDLNKFTEQWTESLETKIDTDIRTKLVEPILNQRANQLLRKNGKTAQKYHQHHKDNLLWKKFQENKKQHKENLSKNPNLVTSIVEEGGSMDMICIHAIANVLKTSIKINNVDGTFFPDLICPDDWDKNNIDNSYLIHAIMETKGDDISSSDLNKIRKAIANQIRTNQQIGNIIENGYHRYYISQVDFGNKKLSPVQELRNLPFDENFNNDHIIGLVGVHGNGYSYGIKCLSKQKIRESEHLIPDALVKRLCKVMCIRYIIGTKHAEAVENQQKEKELFDNYMKNGVPKIELDKFMVATKNMLTICIPYSDHHNKKRTWSSFKSLYPNKWTEAENYIDSYKSIDDNKNDLLFHLVMKQYEHLLNNKSYPKIRQGFAKYFELSESRGFINSDQRHQLMNKYGLSDISDTKQVNQLPIDHKYYHIYNDVYQKSLSMTPIGNRPKRYTGQLL